MAGAARVVHDPGQFDGYVPHAHDVYVQGLAEFGLVGIVAGIVALGLLARLMLTGLRSNDPTWQKIALAAVFTVGLMGTQQLVDMFMNVPALLLAAALPLAWLDARSLGEAKSSLGDPGPEGLAKGSARDSWAGRGVAVAMILGTIVSAVGLVRSEAIATTARQGVDAANAGDWSAAARRLSAAAAADPDMPAYSYSAGIAAANIGDLEAASRLLERSATQDDYPIAWLDLAAVRWRLGDSQGARDALDRAERLGLEQLPVTVAAGWLRLQLGDHDQGIDDLSVAVHREPSLIQDLFWDTSDQLREVRAELQVSLESSIAQSIADPDSAAAAFRLALFSGDEQSAASAVSKMSPEDQQTFQHILDAWTGSGDADAELLAQVQRDPNNLGLLLWARLTAAHDNHLALVQRYDTWLWLANAAPGTPPFARITSSGELSNRQVGLEHYEWLYRRPLPDVQILLGLPQIEYQDQS